jgi:hypothetical protein
VRPAFTIVWAAAGAVRKRSKASAAAGCRALLVITPVNENPGWSAAGIGPTNVTPGV